MSVASDQDKGSVVEVIGMVWNLAKVLVTVCVLEARGRGGGKGVEILSKVSWTQLT